MSKGRETPSDLGRVGDGVGVWLWVLMGVLLYVWVGVSGCRWVCAVGVGG